MKTLIVREWKVNRKDMLGMLAFLCVIFLVFMGIALVVMHFDGGKTWFPFATWVTAVGMMVIFFVYSLGYAPAFRLALSMGSTRKEFMVSYSIRLLCNILLVWLLLSACSVIETGLYHMLKPTVELEAAFSIALRWQIMLPITIALWIIPMFVGTLYAKFGKNGLWFFWILWMFCCLILPRMFHAQPDASNKLDRAAYSLLSLLQQAPTSLLIGLGAAMVCGMGTTILVFGKQQAV